jgi:hypothetical protein
MWFLNHTHANIFIWLKRWGEVQYSRIGYSDQAVGRMNWGLNCSRAKSCFSSLKTSRLALGPNHQPIYGTGCSFHWRKRLGCEADHSAPYSAEVRNEWSFTSFHLT